MLNNPLASKSTPTSNESMAVEMNSVAGAEIVQDPLIIDDGGEDSAGNVAKGSITKVAVCFAFLTGSLLAQIVVVAIIHDYIPPGEPLPDAWFWLFEERHHWTYINEASGVVGMLMGLIVVLVSPKRLIILCRGFYLTGLLYAGRLATLWVTLLPRATPNMICAPRLTDPDFSDYLRRTLIKLATLGTESSAVSRTCGDTIFSGHTIVFLMPSLVVGEYATGPWKLLYRPLQVMAWIGMAGLLMTRSHYTVDVILAYFFTTRVFWSYHNLVDAGSLGSDRGGDFISNMIWYPMVRYIEDW